jgi:hypothetical protein
LGGLILGFGLCHRRGQRQQQTGDPNSTQGHFLAPVTFERLVTVAECIELKSVKLGKRYSSFAIGLDRSDRPFRGFSPGKTTPHDPSQTTVIAKML